VRLFCISFFNCKKLKNGNCKTYFKVIELKNEMKGGERHGL